MLKSDEELRETFKIELRENNLIYIDFFSAEREEDNNARQADLVVEGIKKEVDRDRSQNYSFLIDLTKAETMTYISDHAKKIYTGLSAYTNFKKAAVVGRSLFMEVTVNLMLQASGRGSSFKWFNNLEEARKWIESG